MAALGPGSVFAGFRIEAVAGRGGMGVVFRARQARPNRVVALKVIAPGVGELPGFRERFEREAELAAAIEHPNVVPVYEVGEHDGRLYLVTRYVEGTDLRALIVRERGIEPGRAVRLVAQIAAALDAAHARGLVHRDVKPANVLLSAEGGTDHAYLTDFGLTKLVGESTVTGSGIVGTPSYMAPEQLAGSRIDARADVYALGCVLYEMLVDEVPFPRAELAAAMHAHFVAEPPRPSALRPGELPAAFDGVVATALAKDPAARYQSAGDLARAALAAVESRALAAPPRVVPHGAAARTAGPTAPVSSPSTTVAPAPAASTEAGRRPFPLVAALAVAAVALLVLAAGAVGLVLALSGGDDDTAPSVAPRSADTRIRLGQGIGPVGLGFRKAEVDRAAGEPRPERDPGTGAYRFRYRVGTGELLVVYQRTPGDMPVTVADPDPRGVTVAGLRTRSPAFTLAADGRRVRTGLEFSEVRGALVGASASGATWEERRCEGFSEIGSSAPFGARLLWRAAWRDGGTARAVEFEMALLPSVLGGEDALECGRAQG